MEPKADKYKRKHESWTKAVYMRQIYGDKRKMNGARALKGYLLSSIVPNQSSLKNIFLGFSVDGNYVFSYSFKTSCNFTSTELVYAYEYKLQIWQFSPGKKLRKLASVSLFPNATICSELYLAFVQFVDDPSKLTILGHEAQKLMSNESNNCWTSTVAFFSIISLKFLSSSEKCSENIALLESPIHSFMYHYSIICTVSASTTLMYFLKFPHSANVFILNAGTSLYAFKLKNQQTAHHSVDTDTQDKTRLFLDSSAVCLSCHKVLSHKCLSAISVLEVEHYLQWACENYCKHHNLMYIGFRDYESHIINESSSDNEIYVLFAVLIEIADSRSFWEAKFTITWDLVNGPVYDASKLNYESTQLKENAIPHGWDRLNAVKRDINAYRLPVSKTSSPHVLSNIAVLKHHSLPYMFDHEGLCAIVL